MKDNAKPAFAAIPVRALADDRLSALHFRVLGAVAFHDRFGGNGAGCFASQARLAEYCGCHYTALSHALADLRAYGYVQTERQNENKRKRVHRVLYAQSDHFPPLSGDLDTWPAEQQSPDSCSNEQVFSCPDGQQSPGTVGRENSEATDFLSESSPIRYPVKRDNKSGETERGANFESMTALTGAVRARLKALGIPQWQLASRMQISKSQLCNLLACRRKPCPRDLHALHEFATGRMVL
ncbi:helix-turn-helix domain-containing protein [Oceanibaculum indicum]|uniref:Helix-turn-helix protein n=1 Tax=Oceanibaculum indicum TaxID=526216 RepID=A0A420WR69_9PROT|nr:helix-turn-helix domain-containing protein [Oceanibaculum indicum]RKQ73480.1 helix-turn-helix protein [Oceanibaculum indicum]